MRRASHRRACARRTARWGRRARVGFRHHDMRADREALVAHLDDRRLVAQIPAVEEEQRDRDQDRREGRTDPQRHLLRQDAVRGEVEQRELRGDVRAQAEPQIGEERQVDRDDPAPVRRAGRRGAAREPDRGVGSGGRAEIAGVPARRTGAPGWLPRRVAREWTSKVANQRRMRAGASSGRLEAPGLDLISIYCS